jgi:hypothetical protein
MRIELGRWVYGAAAIGFGVITLVWREFSVWQQNVPHGQALVYLLAAVEILGGPSFGSKRRGQARWRWGACIFFALTWVPRIAAQPRVYDLWGNFFEQFSIVCGALITYGMLAAGDAGRAGAAARIGYFGFGS